MASWTLHNVFKVHSCYGLFPFFPHDFLYSSERGGGAQTGGGAKAEGEAGSRLSGEPDPGLNPRLNQLSHAGSPHKGHS